MAAMLNRFFALERHRTTARVEVIGGITTFVTMAYIIVVNPAILAFAGMPTGPATVATILAAVFGSAMMGFYANRPIAVAPYMGENAFVAFGLTAMGIAWPQALGAVFVSGVLFLLLTMTGIRAWMANAVSTSMKHSFAAGIGLFMALIGLYEAGIVTSFVTGLAPQALLAPGASTLRAPDVPLKLGNLRDPQVGLAILGFVLIVALQHRRVKGAILLGMAATGALGLALGFGTLPQHLMALPFVGDYSLSLAFQLDIPGVLTLSFLPVLLTLFLMGFLDTLGTLVAVGAAGDLLDGRGNLPEVERPMLVDAVSCMFSGLIGTTTTGAYIESATGIREGARTGLAAVTTAVLFAASLFFIPLVEPLQRLRFAYAPALVAVGLAMMGSFRQIDFEDLTEAAPAFATIVMMVFTYNIANGLTAGLVLYPLVKIAAGKGRELRAGSVVLGLLCAVYYVFGLPH
ncbi:MAG: NCS2 family permease [Vicinamibacteria bacterium]|nr:NCS2 family permease [Vicinamibacteria bacterium]